MYIKKLIFFTFLILFICRLNAQVNNIGIKTDSNIQVYENPDPGVINSVGLFETIPPGNNSVPWVRQISNHTEVTEHDVPNPALFKKLKAQANKAMMEGNGNMEMKVSNEDATVQPPTMGINFLGNLTADETPPDNAIAISNGGFIVSAINSDIMYYDINGNKLYDKSFFDFLNNSTLTGKLYDPTLIYDPSADRFIFILLHGDNSTNSKLIICFSKSNNPFNDGWNVYYISTGTYYAGKWLDFPRAAVSSNELFVSGNVFYDNSGPFYSALLYQITKSDGYSGNAKITVKAWKDIKDAAGHSAFAIIPVPYGHNNVSGYGPGIWLLSDIITGSDTVFLYHITNDQTHSPTMLSYAIKTNNYVKLVPADAQQKSTGNPGNLITNDCRILSAFFLNNIIQYVFNSQNNLDPDCAINYNRLNVTTKTNTQIFIGVVGYSMSYPSIASASAEGSNNLDALIGFLYSGKSIYPEFRADYVNNAGSFSVTTLIKSGTTYVDMISGADERWGDYSGISRKFNAGVPTVWVSGCFGAPSGTNLHSFNTWIAQIENTTSGIPDVTAGNIGDVKVYPNPPVDLFHVEFNIKKPENIDVRIIDMSGKTVKVLYQDYTEEGKTVITFNKLALQTGIYFVVVSNESHILKTVKVEL